MMMASFMATTARHSRRVPHTAFTRWLPTLAAADHMALMSSVPDTKHEDASGNDDGSAPRASPPPFWGIGDRTDLVSLQPPSSVAKQGAGAALWALHGMWSADPQMEFFVNAKQVFESLSRVLYESTIGPDPPADSVHDSDDDDDEEDNDEDDDGIEGGRSKRSNNSGSAAGSGTGGDDGGSSAPGGQGATDKQRRRLHRELRRFMNGETDVNPLASPEFQDVLNNGGMVGFVAEDLDTGKSVTPAQFLATMVHPQLLHSIIMPQVEKRPLPSIRLGVVEAAFLGTQVYYTPASESDVPFWFKFMKPVPFLFSDAIYVRLKVLFQCEEFINDEQVCDPVSIQGLILDEDKYRSAASGMPSTRSLAGADGGSSEGGSGTEAENPGQSAQEEQLSSHVMTFEAQLSTRPGFLGMPELYPVTGWRIVDIDRALEAHSDDEAEADSDDDEFARGPSPGFITFCGQARNPAAWE